MRKGKFISFTVRGCYDVIVNTDTIKYVERSPEDKENEVWVWTDWASSGYVVVEESLEAFRKRL